MVFRLESRPLPSDHTAWGMKDGNILRIPGPDQRLLLDLALSQ